MPRQLNRLFPLHVPHSELRTPQSALRTPNSALKNPPNQPRAIRVNPGKSGHGKIPNAAAKAKIMSLKRNDRPNRHAQPWLRHGPAGVCSPPAFGFRRLVSGLRFQASVSFGPPFHWFSETLPFRSQVSRLRFVPVGGSLRPGADISRSPVSPLPSSLSSLQPFMPNTRFTKRTQFQNGVSTVNSMLSANSAPFFSEKRTQFGPDTPIVAPSRLGVLAPKAPPHACPPGRRSRRGLCFGGMFARALCTRRTTTALFLLSNCQIMRSHCGSPPAK